MTNNIEEAVRGRYATAATTVEPQLCCPAPGYNTELLENVPREIVDVDYGCGDPSKWVQRGDTVLDLGSGSGKICYIAAQIVGPEGKVIGVDFNAPMLDVARKHQAAFAQRIGHDVLSFRKGRIQDLALDLDVFDAWLREHPVASADDYLASEERAAAWRTERPLIASGSVDCILSNCVLNLVAADKKRQLFDEMYRVLARGGRCVISDIVSDEDIPQHLRSNPELWSGCVSGAYREDAFLAAFEDAGFHGIEILDRAIEPWRVIEGIEFRSVTVRAFKGKDGPCLDRNQAVVYQGPWKSVTDDDGHTLYRGHRMAVCDKTFKIYTREPYAEQIKPVPPHTEVPLDAANQYDCRRNARRTPAETKGENYTETRVSDSSACCGPNTDCC